MQNRVALDGHIDTWDFSFSSQSMEIHVMSMNISKLESYGLYCGQQIIQ
jgi:hypothetical protein